MSCDTIMLCDSINMLRFIHFNGNVCYPNYTASSLINFWYHRQLAYFEFLNFVGFEFLKIMDLGSKALNRTCM